METKRKIITVAVCLVGLVFALAGELGWAFLLDAGALFWFWAFRPKAPPPSAPAPDTVRVVDGAAATDGIRGAFDRLDPAWQRWLGGLEG